MKCPFCKNCHFAIDQSVIKRFWTKVKKTATCWEWQGTLSYMKGGPYPVIHIKSRIFLAHRVAYEIFNGEVPVGLVVDHQCNNTKCVNPAHLKAMTQPENALRGNSPAMLIHRERVKDN